MATALDADDFDVQHTAIDARKNIVFGWGTITLNNDYAADYWTVTPAFLGVKSIISLSICGDVLGDGTQDCILILEKVTDGYDIQALSGLDDGGWTHSDQATGFNGKTLEIMFLGIGLHEAA